MDSQPRVQEGLPGELNAQRENEYIQHLSTPDRSKLQSKYQMWSLLSSGASIRRWGL